ncbi:[Pyruvate dehydrogenase [acetyl-transferring]]-phosphatase 1, mitochondrial [Lithohypha guttulata]|uniref:[Pyruvate dehydrogenase [acetyl-transferring]]-phosphatase 1, mitochondrial n=1 Tax=Lithohypha guttulata TaxID=1690604 RepID=A0AAN7T7C0_9EURO|nr:[Pyruvate dehydrogenase [acetyl-transferring]]-phosphatase 1, mitochondrial [Lithohypha guttulata]KAK5091117.1 [Pyruvate dehydrogenase [acetyl-transferring]]-phosphatase 1, mitochondrial [Lithohypha guttulata]
MRSKPPSLPLPEGVAYVAYKGPSLQQNPAQARSLTTNAPPQITPIAAVTHDRKALVVDNDQFFTGQIVGDGPLAKDTDDRGRKVLEMLSPDQATERIRKNEQSYLVGRGRGVVRYDVVQLPSNDPIEDDHAEKIIEVPNSVAATDDGAPSSDWMFWGVFDGHSGWTTSAKLRQALISFAARELNTTYKAAVSSTKSPFPDAASIDAALKSAFTKLDNEICIESVNKVFANPRKPFGAELLAPALSGSCALLSFYDTRSNLFRVACTGDSRAVLGRRNPKSGKWFATPLSEDQTGSNPNEEARMRAEHPGEDKVIWRGRVLGNLEPTRAFGDAAYKWTKDIQEQIQSKFFGRTPNPLLRTPPYVTAEPVVTTTKIEPRNGDFVVLATDGLWEMLTNEEVVGLVGQWVEAQQNGTSPAKSSGTAWLTSWFSGAKPQSQLPVEKGGNTDKTGKPKSDIAGKEDLPIRQQQWQIPQDNNMHSRFVVEDKNAATHLIRNALGGKDKDMVCALLTLPSPYSRRYRDDLTVEVIFFGEGASDGAVRVNEEASSQSNNDKLKPKL